jgi:hypothetical protein
VSLASGEPTKYVRDRNPHVADARTAATLAGLDGNDVLVVHDKKFSIIPGSAQQQLLKLLLDPERPVPVIRRIADKNIGQALSSMRQSGMCSPLATPPPKDYLEAIIARNGIGS